MKEYNINNYKRVLVDEGASLNKANSFCIGCVFWEENYNTCKALDLIKGEDNAQSYLDIGCKDSVGNNYIYVKSIKKILKKL